MARNKNVSPEVGDELAKVAREIRRKIFGGDGVPVWGTKFSEIESKGMAVGLELARLIMEQSVDEQKDQMPDSALDTGGGIASRIGQAESTLTTGAGDVEWDQPECYSKETRRSFFPSSESFGS